MIAPGRVFRRELRQAIRRGGATWLGLAFFAVAAALVPLGVGPGPATLARIGPGILWVMALLATLLTLEALFEEDFADGTLEQWVSWRPGGMTAALPVLVLAKLLARWLVIGVPLAVGAPVLGLMYALPPAVVPVLVGGLLLGTPTLLLIGAAAAALVVGARRGGVLVTLLALPLYVPVLIFGTSAVEAVAAGRDPSAALMLLAAMLCAAIPLAPWAAAAALRGALD